MKRLTIAVDMDGVLMDSHTLHTELMNYRLGTTVKREDINEWHFWKDRGYDKEFWETFDFMNRTGLRLKLPMMDWEATRVISQWGADGHKVYVLTCNDGAFTKIAKQWITNTADLFLPVVSLGRISSVRKLDAKWDILVDDSPHVAAAFLALPPPESGPDREIILYDQPWNRKMTYFPRAKSWDDVEKEVKAYVNRIKGL